MSESSKSVGRSRPRRRAGTGPTSQPEEHFSDLQTLLPHMERQGEGAIVIIASVSGIRWLGVPYISYAATKAAVIQFTRVIALQYARSGIRANTILPGMMNTPMVGPKRWSAGVTSNARWGAWAMRGMLRTRRCSSRPTRRNTLPALSWSSTAGSRSIASEHRFRQQLLFREHQARLTRSSSTAGIAASLV
jgi:NAD(P)-dependent dehydrogenase (short-subunit alcohol dehydrogenase family)